MKISLIRNVRQPSVSSEGSAGIDFYVPNDFRETRIGSLQSLLIPSGVKMAVPADHVLIAFNKSGVCSKYGLVVGACVVDSDYQGEIHMHVINTTLFNVVVTPGQKLMQFVLLPYVKQRIEIVSDANLFASTSERGEKGFGSSGT